MVCLHSHFVGVGVVGQVGALSGFWLLAALGLIPHPEVLLTHRHTHHYWEHWEHTDITTGSTLLNWT